MLIVIIPLVLFALVKRIAAPLEKLRNGMEIIANGNLDHRLTVASDDEVGALTSDLNTMTERLKEVTVSRNELTREIEAGKIEVSYEDFDLYDVISEAVALFKKDVQDKGLEMDIEAVHLMMHTDRRRLLQSIVNLISNAVKFTEKGTVRIQNPEQGVGRNLRLGHRHGDKGGRYL